MVRAVAGGSHLPRTLWALRPRTGTPPTRAGRSRGSPGQQPGEPGSRAARAPPGRCQRPERAGLCEGQPGGAQPWSCRERASEMRAPVCVGGEHPNSPTRVSSQCLPLGLKLQAEQTSLSTPSRPHGSSNGESERAHPHPQPFRGSL